MLKSFDELTQKVKNMENKNVVIAAAHTDTALEAALMVKRERLANCILVGEGAYISEYLDTNAPELSEDFQIMDTGKDLVEAAKVSVALIKQGGGDLILKGKCDTGTLLKAVLDKEKGLRTGSIMSDVLVYETSEKLVLMGDGGFIPLPDVKEKISIIKNCVSVAHSLDNPNPKVALLTHSEKVSEKIPSTVDAALIARMNARGQITGCTIDGPLAFDNAVSKHAAELKGIISDVAGDADILIVPNIEAGNIFGKALTYYCHYRVAHVIMGAQVPILIASRADDAETKMLSIVLGIVSA